MSAIPARLRRRHPAEEGEKPSAWALWKALPRTKPYLRPYRRTLLAVLALTILTAVFGLAEPWPLAIILTNVLQAQEASGIIRFVFGPDPTVWVILVTMVLARFLITA